MLTRVAKAARKSNARHSTQGERHEIHVTHHLESRAGRAVVGHG
jgi:hypothetical protein